MNNISQKKHEPHLDKGCSMKTYTTIQGDMWDSIAYKVYGDEKYAGVLMQSNVDLLEIFIFGAGTVLTVPELSVEEETKSPPWRE